MHSKHRRKTQFIIQYNIDKCFLVLVIYISLLCFIYFSLKVENNSFKKSQYFILFFCFCLKQSQPANLLDFALWQIYSKKNLNDSHSILTKCQTRSLIQSFLMNFVFKLVFILSHAQATVEGSFSHNRLTTTENMSFLFMVLKHIIKHTMFTNNLFPPSTDISTSMLTHVRGARTEYAWW